MKNNNNLIKPTSEYWSDSYDTEKWDMAQEAFKTWYYSKSQGIEPTPPTPIYSSVTTEEIDCFGYDKYKVTTTEYYSGYSQDTLVVYDTEVVNTLIERNSPDCGYARPRIYSSYTVTDIMCEEDYTKLTINTTHYISGYSDVSPIVFEEYSSKTETVGREERSEYCGYVRPVGYSSYTETDFSCDGYTKLITAVTHYLSGYTDEEPIVYTEYSSKTEYDTEIESEDCGYLKGWNARVILSDGTEQLFKYDDGIVPSGAFARRTDIVAAEFKNTITKLDVGVFQYCDKLTSVTLTDNITSIGTACFWACGKLKSITIPKGMTSIPQNCFTRCYGLTDIVIPNNITSIGKGAFTSCSNVTAITIPDSVTYIGANAFEGWKTSGTLNCSDSWYYGLSETNINNLGNVYYWKERPIGYSSYTESSYDCEEDYTKVTTTITHYLSGYTDVTPVVYKEYSSKTETEREENSEDCGYVPPVFGNITVTYTDGTTETFTYEGGEIPSEEFYNNKDIVSVTMDENIKIIGENCFKGCTKLTSVTIGDSVEGLGGRAFEGCTKLESITIPSSVGGISEFTFRNCTGLKRVIIEDGITSIGDRAFYGCTSLEYIEIPDSVDSIASGAFTNVPTEGTLKCSDDWYDNLTSKNKTNLGNVYHWRMLFDGCKVRLTLSDGSTSSVTFDDCEIPNDYLNNRQDIVKADIGNGITSIKTKAFWYCKQLSSVTIPDSVTDFGVTVFYNIGMDCLYSLNGKFLCQVNTKLTSYDINEGTETIIYGALWKCESITSVTIPDSVTTIKGEAFAYCSSITSIGSKGSGCSIEIPSGVTEFNSGVFAHCTSLTSVTIPDSVTKIGANLFNDCTSLSSVTIPDSVTKILGGAFTSVPTEGTLYCKEDWFNNLSETHKTNLGNLNDWTKVWI